MLIEELIFERSRASLYHFTSIKNAFSIINDDAIMGGYRNRKQISLTRSSDRLPFKKYFHSKIGGYKVRFELDQDKLKTKYKIMQYDDFSKSKDRKGEAEEVVINGPISPLNKYLIEIRLMHVKEAFSSDLDIPHHWPIMIRAYTALVKHPKFNKNDKKDLIDLFNQYVNKNREYIIKYLKPYFSLEYDMGGIRNDDLIMWGLETNR